MAGLRDIARGYIDELRDGIAWVIVYKDGRSWEAEAIWSDVADGEWSTEDLETVSQILKIDPNAVFVNGYYCGRFFPEMSIAHAAGALRWHYEGRFFRLADQPAVVSNEQKIAEAREIAARAGLPFSEHLSDGAEDDLDPYVYDGYMTLEDYEAMCKAADILDTGLEPERKKEPVKWTDLTIWGSGIMSMLMAMPSYVGRDVYRQDSGSG